VEREGRYQGQVDVPLSAVGEAQARQLGDRLRDVHIDRAVASPLSRAERTAELALGPSREAMLRLDGLRRDRARHLGRSAAAEIGAMDAERPARLARSAGNGADAAGRIAAAGARPRLAGAGARDLRPRAGGDAAGRRARRGQSRAAVPHPRPAAVAAVDASARRRPRSTCSKARTSTTSTSCASTTARTTPPSSAKQSTARCSRFASGADGGVSRFSLGQGFLP
jgi:hypothetical protein